MKDEGVSPEDFRPEQKNENGRAFKVVRMEGTPLCIACGSKLIYIEGTDFMACQNLQVGPGNCYRAGLITVVAAEMKPKDQIFIPGKQ